MAGPILTAGYLAAVWLGLELRVQPEGLAVFWPAAGVALAALVALPPARWPALLAAFYAVHLLAELAVGFPLLLSAAYPLIALAEVAVGAALTRRLGGPTRSQELDRWGLIALAGAVTLVAAPLSATAAAALQDTAGGGEFWSAWILWWSAEVLGSLTVAPALLAAPSLARWWRHAPAMRRFEAALALLAIALVALSVFSASPSRFAVAIAALAMPYPLLVLLGIRVGPGGVALGTMALAAIAAFQSRLALGPIAAVEPDPVLRVLILQAYLAVVTGPALLLGLVSREAARAAADLREVLDHSSDAVFVVEADADGAFRYASYNRRAELATGFTSAEVRGRTPHDLLPPDAAERVAANYRRCFELGRPVQYEETLTMAGVTRTWDTTLAPILDEHGAVARVAGFARDITERRLQQIAHAALEAQLRQAQKMDAVGRLAGGMAHDFNNILTAIIGHAELLADRLDPRGAERESVDAILEAGGRASALVEQVLTFARRREQPRTTVVMTKVLDEVLRLVRATVPSTIDVQVSLDAGELQVVADPTQIHQAVMNLVSNATYAMREQGGVLTVSLEACVVDQTLARLHAPLRPGPGVRLTVGDTGSGMSPETLEHVFEPFFTTKPAGEGTGLGLPMVLGIVQCHEGGLAIESAPGRGTRVSIYLPAATAEQVAELGAPRAPVPAGRGRRILVVDDETAVADVGSRLLESLGYAVTTHSDPEAALAAFRADPSAVDLLLTDLTMPRLTGLVLADEFRRLRPALPVVIATGVPAAVVLGERARMLVLGKPYARQSLGLAVGELLEQSGEEPAGA